MVAHYGGMWRDWHACWGVSSRGVLRQDRTARSTDISNISVVEKCNVSTFYMS